jgi:uncharacterized membrane protein
MISPADTMLMSASLGPFSLTPDDDSPSRQAAKCTTAVGHPNHLGDCCLEGLFRCSPGLCWSKRFAGSLIEGVTMAIGPVQLLVLGFNQPDFHGEIIEELERLRESDTVRVIDSLAVHKDAQGEIEVMHLSNLTRDEAVELGSTVGALIGLGIEGEEGAEAGAAAGAEAAEDGIHAFSDEEAWDVLEDIPNDSAAALILIEHHWAIPLRDAIARAGGFRLSDGFISPLDLIEIGLISAAEAEELHAMESQQAAQRA